MTDRFFKAAVTVTVLLFVLALTIGLCEAMVNCEALRWQQ